MRIVAALFFTLLLSAPVFAHGDHADGVHRMPASPDLLEKVGPAQARELAGVLDSRNRRPEDELYEMMRVARADKNDKVAGTGTCLVILFQWTDHPADEVAHPGSAYADMMFSTGTYATGSMNDYYLENSYGAYGVGGLVHGWATSTDLYADLDPTDYNQVRTAFMNAVTQLDPMIDYSLYDNDGPDGVPNSGDDDGYVDALFFVHAGPGREQTGDDGDIWSHAWSFTGGLATDDGVSCYRYSVEPEMLSGGDLITIGVFAHEYGHVLGLPDLYDTDYSSSGIGNWGLMSGGSWGRRAGDPVGSSPSHLTAWSKLQLGWLTPVTVTADMLGVVIPPIETNATVYRLWRGGVAGDEYFLIENRRRLGFDESLVRRQIDNALPAPEGLLITHVDDALSANSNELHRLVDVVEASPWFHAPDDPMEHLDGPRDYGLSVNLAHYNRGDDGDLWPGFSVASGDSLQWVGARDRDRFADDTLPTAEDYSCDPTGVAVENIALSGDDVVADLLVGVTAPPAIVPDKTLTWTFETDDEGWLFCNSIVHHDGDQTGSCSGAGGLWFGLDDASWSCPPGYGNGWYDFTWKSVAVTAGATVTLRHHYDLEDGYDYGYVQVRCAGDPTSAWTDVATINGFSDCVTDTWIIPTTVITACEIGSGVGAIDVRLLFTSDGGWSAQDGYFCGVGWWIDEVSITNDVSTSVDETPLLPMTATLAAPAPNPFNPSTTLRYYVPEGARNVSLTVFDQKGRRVSRLPVEASGGWNESVWRGTHDDGREAAGGVYYARLTVDGDVQVQKLALIK